PAALFVDEAQMYQLFFRSALLRFPALPAVLAVQNPPVRADNPAGLLGGKSDTVKIRRFFFTSARSRTELVDRRPAFAAIFRAKDARTAGDEPSLFPSAEKDVVDVSVDSRVLWDPIPSAILRGVNDASISYDPAEPRV